MHSHQFAKRNAALLLLMLGLILSACSSVTGQGVAQVGTPTKAGDFVVIWELWGTPTPTPYRPPTTRIAQTVVPTITLSAQNASSQLSGAAARGKALFTGVGSCFTCHDTSSGVKIVGPSLKGVANRAASREPGKSADDYLHESIQAPNAFVVEGFPPGIMPQNFAQQLTKDQINDLVAYLETLK